MQSILQASTTSLVKSKVKAELNLPESLASLKTKLKTGIIAYGKIPLMVFKNCPVKNGKSCKDCDKRGVLTDRMGIEFPIRCRMGYSRLLNSVPLNLSDKQIEIKNADYLILWFETEEKEEIENIIRAFKENKKPEGDFTRGLYFKGVI